MHYKGINKSQTSKIELFAKIFNDWKPLIIFTKKLYLTYLTGFWSVYFLTGNLPEYTDLANSCTLLYLEPRKTNEFDGAVCNMIFFRGAARKGKVKTKWLKNSKALWHFLQLLFAQFCQFLNSWIWWSIYAVTSVETLYPLWKYTSKKEKKLQRKALTTQTQ